MSQRRFREFSRSDVLGTYDYENSSGSSGSLGAFSASSYNVLSDTSVSNFKRRIAKGEIINNAFYHNVRVHELGIGVRNAVNSDDSSVWQNATGDVTGYFANAFGLGYIPNPEVDAMADIFRQAKLGAMSKMDRTPYSFLEDLFEMRKTLSTLKSGLSDAADLAKDFVRIKENHSRAFSVTKATAKAWLTVRYSYRPIVLSAMNAYEATMDHYPAKPTRKTARGMATFSEFIEEIDDIGDANNSVFFRKHNVNIKVRSQILYQDLNPRTGFLYDLGIRAKDVPRTIWAVMPYSWVIDRFFNISSGITAFTNLIDPTLEILAASTTTQVSRIMTMKLDSQSNPDWQLSVSGNQHQVLITQKYRDVWSPSSADLLPPLTGYGLSDFSKVADIASLIVGRLK